MQYLGQLGRARYDSRLSPGPVLELSFIPQPAAVRPVFAGFGCGDVQVQLAPPLIGQSEVTFPEIGRFLGSQRGVLHDAEKRDQPWPAALPRFHVRTFGSLRR